MWAALVALMLLPTAGVAVALRIARQARCAAAPAGASFWERGAVAAGRVAPRPVRFRIGCIFVVLGLVGLWIALVCGLLTWRYAWDLNLAQRSPAFPTVTGEVLSSDVVEGERGGYVPRITYQYVVDEQTYVHDLWRPNPRGLPEELDARLKARWYEPGEQVTVAYDPANPARAALEHGSISLGDYALVLLGISITVLILLGSLFLIGLVLVTAPGAAASDSARLTLLRRLLERNGPPRVVQPHELVPVFYMPWVHVVCIVAAVGCVWTLLTPLLVIPHAWTLVAVNALGLAALTLWPLARLWAVLWALRHGYLAAAEIIDNRISMSGFNSFAEGHWTVHSPAGAFTARYATRQDGYRSLRVGGVAQVLVHPSRPKVVLIITLP